MSNHGKRNHLGVNLRGEGDGNPWHHAVISISLEVLVKNLHPKIWKTRQMNFPYPGQAIYSCVLMNHCNTDIYKLPSLNQFLSFVKKWSGLWSPIKTSDVFLTWTMTVQSKMLQQMKIRVKCPTCGQSSSPAASSSLALMIALLEGTIQIMWLSTLLRELLIIIIKWAVRCPCYKWIT